MLVLAVAVLIAASLKLKISHPSHSDNLKSKYRSKGQIMAIIEGITYSNYFSSTDKIK